MNKTITINKSEMEGHLAGGMARTERVDTEDLVRRKFKLECGIDIPKGLLESDEGEKCFTMEEVRDKMGKPVALKLTYLK